MDHFANCSLRNRDVTFDLRGGGGGVEVHESEMEPRNVVLVAPGASMHIGGRPRRETLSRLLKSSTELRRVQEARPDGVSSWFRLLPTLTGEAKAVGQTSDAFTARLGAAKSRTSVLFAGNAVWRPLFHVMRATASGRG